MRSRYGRKQCYMSHRRYLPKNHKWSSDESTFDGSKEFKSAPRSLFASDFLALMNDLKGNFLSKAKDKRLKISHEKRGKCISCSVNWYQSQLPVVLRSIFIY
ncbi:hypothetical protein Scep_014521 [Stephania cephalantha]|uniref:Uncharacterized protein n=1 Tax=Stephania cephalantha TaxID=152367 RepID=A0AAP0J259_9MAGN